MAAGQTPIWRAFSPPGSRPQWWNSQQLSLVSRSAVQESDQIVSGLHVLLNVANVVAPGNQREPGDSSFLGWNHELTAFSTINSVSVRDDARTMRECCKSLLVAALRRVRVSPYSSHPRPVSRPQDRNRSAAPVRVSWQRARLRGWVWSYRPHSLRETSAHSVSDRAGPWS